MRLGLIGCGRHGKRYLEPRNGGDYITHVLRKSGEPVAGVVLCKTIGELCTAVDGVIIASPMELHAEHAMECLHYNKNILIEKPIATKARDVQRILELADSKGLLVLAAHTMAEQIRVSLDDAQRVVLHYDKHVDNPWLDWGPHLCSVAHDVPELVLTVSDSGKRLMYVTYDNGDAVEYDFNPLAHATEPTPLALCVGRLLMAEEPSGYGGVHARTTRKVNSNWLRAVYGRLFAEMGRQAA